MKRGRGSPKCFRHQEGFELKTVRVLWKEDWWVDILKTWTRPNPRLFVCLYVMWQPYCFRTNNWRSFHCWAALTLLSSVMGFKSWRYVDMWQGYVENDTTGTSAVPLVVSWSKCILKPAFHSFLNDRFSSFASWVVCVNSVPQPSETWNKCALFWKKWNAVAECLLQNLFFVVNVPCLFDYLRRYLAATGNGSWEAIAWQ